VFDFTRNFPVLQSIFEKKVFFIKKHLSAPVLQSDFGIFSQRHSGQILSAFY